MRQCTIDPTPEGALTILAIAFIAFALGMWAQKIAH